MFHVDVFVRTIIALAIILCGLGIYRFYNWTLQLRTPNLLTDLGSLRPDAFTLVYFTTPTCVPCKTVQRPEIEKLGLLLGRAIQVLEIDASEHPDMASRWGVMSVPTTYLIDPRGKLRHVNHGVTRAEKLLMQLHSLK
jgi:thiol-disulfide isomerase/thioredoxin